MAGLSRAAGIIEQGIADKLHLGAQLYVSRDGATVADLAIGEATSGVPMRPDHLMLWMSSVKPVTAVAIGQMWEQGRLGLDDKVAQHIPEFRTKGKEPITIRHVMTHTGGFPRAVGPWTYDPVGMRDRTFNLSLDRGLGFVIDSKHHGAGSAWYGSHCSPRTFGHSGYVSSSSFADPQHRVVVAIVFNGMLDASAAKHDARITAALNAVYEELGLA